MLVARRTVLPIRCHIMMGSSQKRHYMAMDIIPVISAVGGIAGGSYGYMSGINSAMKEFRDREPHKDIWILTRDEQYNLFAEASVDGITCAMFGIVVGCIWPISIPSYIFYRWRYRKLFTKPMKTKEKE